MHFRVPYLGLLARGATGLAGEAAAAVFTDVTLSTLGNVPHTVSSVSDIKIGAGLCGFTIATVISISI